MYGWRGSVETLASTAREAPYLLDDINPLPLPFLCPPFPGEWRTIYVIDGTKKMLPVVHFIFGSPLM
jgi:hypothetical protein